MTNEELTHYGIKGMKWGVRRFQNKDGSLTNAGRQRYNEDINDKKQNDEESRKARQKKVATYVAVGAVAAVAALGVIGYMKYTKNDKLLSSKNGIKNINTKPIDLNSLSNKDSVIKRGTKFQRISSKSFEDYRDSGKQMYASYLKKDNAIYMHDMPKNIEQWRKSGIIKDSGSNVYKYVITMNKDIKVASPKKVVEVYKEVTGDTEAKQYKYQNFITGLVDRDKEVNKKFINKLVELGYNAIIDENDAGSYTTSPLIILNPANDIDISKASKLRKIEQIMNVIMYKP